MCVHSPLRRQRQVCIGGSPSPPFPEEVVLHLTSALGLGSDNIGEMHALVVALELCLWFASSVPSAPPCLVFSDSLHCVSYLSSGWSFPEDPVLARRARKAFDSLTARAKAGCWQFGLYWIRGHSGIPGNELADVAAGRGAVLSRDRPAGLSAHLPYSVAALTQAGGAVSAGVFPGLCGDLRNEVARRGFRWPGPPAL